MLCVTLTEKKNGRSHIASGISIQTLSSLRHVVKKPASSVAPLITSANGLAGGVAPGAVGVVHKLIDNDLGRGNFAGEGFADHLAHTQHSTQRIVGERSPKRPAENNEHGRAVDEQHNASAAGKGQADKPEGKNHAKNCC